MVELSLEPYRKSKVILTCTFRLPQIQKVQINQLLYFELLQKIRKVMVLQLKLDGYKIRVLNDRHKISKMKLQRKQSNHYNEKYSTVK